jgi:hypothetical protein
MDVENLSSSSVSRADSCLRRASDENRAGCSSVSGALVCRGDSLLEGPVNKQHLSDLYAQITSEPPVSRCCFQRSKSVDVLGFLSNHGVLGEQVMNRGLLSQMIEALLC